MTPEQLVGSANEADQKLLAELVQQALTAGTPLNLGRRPDRSRAGRERAAGRGDGRADSR